MAIKHLLQEAYKTTKKLTGFDPSKPGNLKAVLVDDDNWKIYSDSLLESVTDEQEKNDLSLLMENARVSMLENSMYAINPYETLTLPILRVFYPKLIAKEAITVSPIDTPEAIKTFIRASFKKHGDANKYYAPSVSTDISSGPSVGTPVTASMPVPSEAYDVLAVISSTSADTHIERDFEITGVYDGTAWFDVSIIPAVEGHFSSSVDVSAGSDVVSGQVDYLNGTVAISSANKLVTEVRYQCTCSLEENKINPVVTLEPQKIRLYVTSRQISANWSINMEQDMKALFDVSTQSELVNIIGQQIALDINREIINALIAGNSRLNDASHIDTFSKTPPANYTLGEKYWHENIIVPLNALSAQVYNDTNLSQANTIMCNPIDAAILEDLQTFQYNGSAADNGELGYRTATVAGGKWKVLTSSVVPSGKMVLTYKSPDELQAVYVFCPYIPVSISPYPLGAKPSLTIMTRNAQSMIRPAGIAQLNVV